MSFFFFDPRAGTSRGPTRNVPSLSAFSELQLSYTKEVIDLLMKDPNHIRDRNMQFFRDFLVDWEELNERYNFV